MALALNRISALINPNLGNYFRCAYFGCLFSVMRSFTEIYKRNFEISCSFYKKGIDYVWTEDWTLCKQICYFLDVSGKVSSLIRFANYPYTLYNHLNASRLQPFRKTWKHVNLGKTQCWALFVISKAAFTKTAIKPKFDDTFSLKTFRAAVDQCTIRYPILESIETF